MSDRLSRSVIGCRSILPCQQAHSPTCNPSHAGRSISGFHKLFTIAQYIVVRKAFRRAFMIHPLLARGFSFARYARRRSQAFKCWATEGVDSSPNIHNSSLRFGLDVEFPNVLWFTSHTAGEFKISLNLDVQPPQFPESNQLHRLKMVFGSQPRFVLPAPFL